MKLAVRLQVAGMVLVVAGLLVLFGVGVAVVTAGALALTAGVVLEREKRAADIPVEVR